MAQVKISDLSIGDWVKIDGAVTKVWHLSRDNYVNKTTCDYWVKPIPITPEILEKNGFDFQHKGLAFDHYGTNLENGKTLLLSFDRGDNYYLSYAEKGVRGVHEIDCPLRSVHQLQHALRLAGVEKEIEL